MCAAALRPPPRARAARARDPTGPARTLSQEILLTAAQGPTLALISGRTADNPKLLKEVIEAGCTHVYLEKPGAPTVAELEAQVHATLAHAVADRWRLSIGGGCDTSRRAAAGSSGSATGRTVSSGLRPSDF